MDSEALRLAKSTAETVQELQTDMQELRAAVVKNAEELKVFKDAVMGALQAGLAPTPTAATPAAPPSPAPTVPFSSDTATLPAFDRTEAAASGEYVRESAESQPPLRLRSSGGAKRRRLGVNCRQDAAKLQDSSSLAAGATDSEKTEDQPSNLDVILESFNASGDNITNAAQRRHRCEECGNTFTRKSSLNVHMRTHTEEGPFKCDECGDTFKQKKH